MARLAARLAPAQAVPATAIGCSGDAMEAQAEGGAPLTFPGTTGVARPMPGGVVARP
jgi:anhydro-N-acetylmuramic acid kinase